MKKKLTALFLAVVMCMTMSVPAFADDASSDGMTQAEYEDAVRAEIQRQLEAQNAMHLYEDFESILFPTQNNTQATPRATYGTYAPNGGVVSYTEPYTYRGETGERERILSCFDKEDSAAMESILRKAEYTLTALGLFEGVFGAAFSKSLPPQVAYTLGMAGLSAGYSADLIKEAGGYVCILTVADSADLSCATVIIGWDTYPRIVYESDEVLDSSYTPFPAN